MSDTPDKIETRSFIASDKVEGTAVYNPEGGKLGSVANIMIEKRSGKAEYAIMEFGGLFGMGREHYPIPWDMLHYDSEKGGYVVNLDKEQLSDAPKYDTGDTPEYTDDYGRTVYGYYGLSYPMY